jgi:hypothetical protein
VRINFILVIPHVEEYLARRIAVNPSELRHGMIKQVVREMKSDWCILGRARMVV